jgi:cellobiose phosphorylase
MAFARLGDGARAWELLDMINPVNHALDAAAVATYKVEPYVVAADVYGVAPHVGRGGWTWYTGSAGWMYRLIIESLLGLRIEDGRLWLKPLPKPGWAGFEIDYRFGASLYRIRVECGAGEGGEWLDGVRVSEGIALVDDGAEHELRVRVMAGAAPDRVDESNDKAVNILDT